MAQDRFRDNADVDAFVAEHGNPFDSIPPGVVEAHFEAVRASVARFEAENPPHLLYRQNLERCREAIALVDAMENPTADDVWRQGHCIASLARLEGEGEPPAPCQ